LIRLLKVADRAAVPWKNGGGVTSDVMVSPAGATLDTFDWRISIAEIASDGPFSRFPGIDRKLAVLEGKVALTVEGGAPAVLDPNSDPLEFHGESAVTGQLIGGPSMDLNVMTRRGRYTSKLSKQSSAQPKIKTSPTLIIALNPLTIMSGNRLIAMTALDALLIEGSASMTIGPKGADYYLIEITAPRP
jgi:environmental stress-induced protein Ves